MHPRFDEALVVDNDDFIAVCIPPPAKDIGSLQRFYTREDAEKRPEFAQYLADALLWLHNAHGTKATTILAPSVADMSTRIIDLFDLTQAIGLPYGDIWRREDLAADGVFIDEHHAFAMTAGGCMLLHATARGHHIVAHAGRDSLLDRKLIETGAPTPRRAHETIIGAIVDCLAHKDGIAPSEITLRGYFSIGPKMFEHRFDDPIWGDRNRELLGYLNAHWPSFEMNGDENGFYLDLPRLMLEQARAAGIGDVQYNTKTTLPRNGTFAYTRHASEAMRQKKNLVLFALKHP